MQHNYNSEYKNNVCQSIGLLFYTGAFYNPAVLVTIVCCCFLYLDIRQPSPIDVPKVQRNPKDSLLYRAYKQILASYILTNTLWYKAHVQALCPEQLLAVSNSGRPYEGNPGRRERVQIIEDVRCATPKTGGSFQAKWMTPFRFGQNLVCR